MSDPEKKAAKAFGVLSDRGLANRITVYVSEDGKIAYIDKNVQAREDGATVVKKLTELKFKKK